MYVTVFPRGTITFRLDCRLNGRRETLTIGRCGRTTGSRFEWRARCMGAKRSLKAERPQEKQRAKRRAAEVKTFGEFTKRWLQESKMAESCESMPQEHHRPGHRARCGAIG